MTIPFYLPTKNIWGFIFLYILDRMCYCCFIIAFLVGCDVGSDCGFSLYLPSEQ